jgi:hypothetical protein
MTKLIKNKNNFMIIEERQIKFCERNDGKRVREKIEKVQMSYVSKISLFYFFLITVSVEF